MSDLIWSDLVTSLSHVSGAITSVETYIPLPLSFLAKYSPYRQYTILQLYDVFVNNGIHYKIIIHEQISDCFRIDAHTIFVAQRLRQYRQVPQQDRQEQALQQ